MTMVYVLAAVGALAVFALFMVLVDMAYDAGRRQAARWRIYRRVLAEDLAGLRAWAQMTRAHLRAVRQLVRHVQTGDQADGGDGHA